MATRFIFLLTILLTSVYYNALTQTTLSGSLTSNPWVNTVPLNTGSGLTLNLGLGVEYLIVAGGGGGAAGGGGGGGAGGFLTGATFVNPQSYSIIVGAGGAGGAAGDLNKGQNGGNSSAFGFTAIGGGAGGNPTGFANSGGSGGGAGRVASITSGGSAQSGQGFAGGNASSDNRSSAGGGGAGAAGSSASTTAAGKGGDGLASTITGGTVFYAGGGGGSGFAEGGFQTRGEGGNGGGGLGAHITVGGNGSPNTGGGGGGGRHVNGFANAGGSGGSGVVIVRYRSVGSFSSGGNNWGGYTADGDSWRFEQFNSNGNLSFSYSNAHLLATQSGQISGTGMLTYNSPGILRLTGTNTYTGGTTIMAGELVLGSPGALGISGTINFGGGTLQYSSINTADYSSRFSTTANQLYSINTGGQNITFATALTSNGGSLTKRGSGTLTLSGNNSYTGSTTVSAGALNIRHANALGTTANGTTVSSGAALELQEGITVGAEALTLNGTGVSSGGALRNISGDNIYGGTVTLASASSIHSDAGTLTLNASNAITASNIGLTVGGAGNTHISGAITTGTGTLTKNGSGTLTLSGTNTYSGTTSVNAGTLLVNGNQSGAAGAVTVASGATLGGTGRVGGAITAQFGSTISPGASAPGVLTASNNLTYSTGATFRWELNANDATAADRGIDFDGVNVTSGTLSIGTGITATLLFNASGSAVDFTDAFWKSDHSWLVFDNANAPTLTSATNIFDNITVSNDKNNRSLTSVQYLSNARFYFSKVGNDVYLNYDSRVPETSVSVTSLSGMSSCAGTPSSAQTFTVSGQYLAGNITVTAPTGFEVSLDGTSYAASQSISPSAGSVTNATVHVRITSVASGSLSGSVSITTDGGETKLVSVSGLAGTFIASNAGTDIHSVPNLAKTLAANAPANGTGTWSIVSGPNTSAAQFGSASSNTSSFTPTVKGNYVLRWTITSGTCTPTTDDVTVKVVDDIWLGTVSSDFNNPANWASGTVPTGGGAMDFVVDPAATRNIVLTGPLTLGSFDFNGTSVKLVLGNHDATIGAISNPSTTAFVQTNGTGRLRMNIANTAALLFPVGTSHYSPVTITNRTGQADQFFASVSDGVYTDGNTSGTLTGSAPRVDLTWQIGNTIGNTRSGSVDLLFAWQNPQLVGVLSNPKLFHHDATQWNKMTAGTTSYPAVNSLSYTGFTGSFTRSFSVAADDAVLPVTWLSFTGKKVQQGIELNWSTSSEQNTKDFQVQHSINAQQWTAVGSLSAAGNSNTVRNYRFLHEGPFKNSIQHYYRILQRDLDGKFSYSKVIRIEYPEAPNSVVVYPNPASDVLHVNLAKRQEIRLVNMQGVVVWKGMLAAGRHEIQVAHLAAGAYILQAEKQVYKLIIE